MLLPLSPDLIVEKTRATESPNLLPEVIDWCRDNLTGPCFVRFLPFSERPELAFPFYLVFQCANDALHFKMMWG